VFDGPEVATFSKFARVIGAHLTLAAIAIHQKQEIVSSLRDFSELQVWRGIFEMRPRRRRESTGASLYLARVRKPPDGGDSQQPRAPAKPNPG
jgi:hypothetical protein